MKLAIRALEVTMATKEEHDRIEDTLKCYRFGNISYEIAESRLVTLVNDAHKFEIKKHLPELQSSLQKSRAEEVSSLWVDLFKAALTGSAYSPETPEQVVRYSQKLQTMR